MAAGLGGPKCRKTAQTRDRLLGRMTSPARHRQSGAAGLREAVTKVKRSAGLEKKTAFRLFLSVWTLLPLAAALHRYSATLS